MADVAPRGAVQRSVIILSTGRTGTMALAHYFDAHYADVTATHEPKPSRTLRIYSGRYMAGKFTLDDLRARLHRARTDLLAKVPTTVYVESNWYLYGFLEVLRDVFPRPRILHVVRDPRTLIPSYINFGTFRFPKALLVNLVPYWYVRPEQQDPQAPQTWSKMTPAERLAFHWKVVNTQLSRGRELYGDDYLLLRYEDIFAPGCPGLGQVADFIGVPRKDETLRQASESKVNASRRKSCPPWKEWEEPQRQRVLAICGDLMREYGYSFDSK